MTSSLAGLVPGLKVMNRGGQPGADGSNLSIRGFGAPLVLVDGIEQAFGYMDPNEIESISILKMLRLRYMVPVLPMALFWLPPSGEKEASLSLV